MIKKILKVALPLLLLAVTVTILVIAFAGDEDANGETAAGDGGQYPLYNINNYVITINGNRYYALMTLYDLVAYGDFYLASVGSRTGEDGEVFVDDLFDMGHQPRIMTRYGQGEGTFSFPIITNYLEADESQTNGSLLLMGLRYRYDATDDTVVLPLGLSIGMDLDSIESILGEPYNIGELDANNKVVTYSSQLTGEVSGTMTLELFVNTGGEGLTNLNFVFQRS